MARVSRLIIYDSDDEEALKEQIEKSLPEGVHEKAVTITIINIAKTSNLNDTIKQSISNLRIRK